MGEQPKKLNDLDPADIERIGDEAVARMTQRVESRLALDAPQEEKPAETPAPAMSPSAEESENAKASEAESDKWSPEQQKAKESIIAKLEGQKDYWIGKLNAATDKEAFSAVIDEAARQSDKWTETTGPGLVAGKLFRALLHDYGDNLSEKQRADLKKYSWELQQQVSDVYAKKKNEIYSEPEISALVPDAPAAPVTGGDVHTRLPETLPEIPAQPSLHSPAGPQGKPNAKEVGGRRRKLKPGAGRVKPKPEPTAEPQTPVPDPVSGTNATENKKESYELYKGKTWEKVIEFQGKTGKELLLVEDIIGDTVRLRKERRFDGVSSWQQSFESAPYLVAEMLEREGYTKSDESLTELPKQEAKKAATDISGEQYEFRVLKNGEEQQYLADDDTLFIVRKKKDGYYFVDGDGELSGPVTQDVMRHQAEAERWRMIEATPAVPEAEPEAVPAVETAPVAEAAPVTPEAPAAPELPKVETPADSLQQKIDALRTDMEEFRYKYAEMDYEKNSAWKTLTGFFRNLKDGVEKDPDTEYWKSEYMSKLMELQNLELEQIKQEGLKGDELKERMAGMLRYYKIEQAAELYRDRTQVQIDKKGFVKEAWGIWEHIVKEYGKLSTSAKIFAGVALAGLSLSAGGAAALYIVAIRRAMGATGVAMTADALLAARAERKDKEKADAHLAQFKEGFEVKDVEATVEKFAVLLKGEIEQLNNGLQKKKRNALYRKGISLGIGVGLVLGGSVLASQASGMMHHESAATSTESASAPAAASAPEQASSAPARTEVPAATQETPSASQADVQGFKVEFERYQVTRDNRARGLWGILEQHLPKDMLPQAEKNRIIQSLENAIQQKLDHMSPAELKAVGFPTGNINNIYAGTQIDLGKLLTPDEVQAVMEGKNVTLSHVEAPSHVGGERLASSPVPDTAPSAAPQEAVSGQATAPQPSSVKPAPVLDTHRSETLVQKNIPVTDPLTYLREHPEALGRYNSTLGRLRMGIFMMNPGEAGVPMEYDYTLNGEKLGSTQISQVLKDLKGFDRGFLQNLDYDRVKNPLHYDQMRELGKFIEASGKAFGPKLASVEAGESIDHYTRRMAMVALQTGKEIKGFYKP